KANRGHSCVKGRFAWGYANHQDRILNPMIRETIDQPWREVSWDEALGFASGRIKRIKAEHGTMALGGITSSRCTNEETFLVQKLIRAVFGSNNTDTCARVCHSPTGYGLKTTFGTSAGTQDFDSVQYTDVALVIGANPTDGHPVFASRLKKRLREGAKLIVIDPRRIDLVRTPHVEAAHHLPLQPGTNVAVLTAMAHVIVTEGLANEKFIQERCDTDAYAEWARFVSEERHSPEFLESVTRVPAADLRAAARLYATGGNGAIYYGLGVTEHSQGSSTVMAIANLAMVTGNIGRKGVGVNPLRGQNNVQGAADMGAQPHQGAGYLDVTKADVNKLYQEHYGVPVPSHIGWKIPEMFNAAIDGRLKALWLIGEDVVQTDPNTNKVIKAMDSLELLVVQELFMTETAKYADVVLPGASFLEKSGTFTNGERRVQRVNAVVEPLEGTKSDGQIIVDLMNRMGFEQPDYHPSWVLEEISRIVPFFKGIRWETLGENGKQWPVAADGTDTQILHTETFKRGKGKFFMPEWIESKEVAAHGKDYPYIITTNRELEHYNCGTMTRRTRNNDILTEDVLLIHPDDARANGLAEGDMVCVESPRGKVDIKARITDEVKPGILSSTFHFPEIMLNIITSDVHDTEALCPEYKVVSCRIRKARKGHLRKAGEVVEKA
ncbi:MAG: formate dehydrogenase subunit alpha, partial [Flavobacteriales bacterium]|nr:formate dehydrogenase subunit alpha [Flavobacteriales bacterium]